MSQKEPLRIGLTGTHGSGKSTLANALAPELNLAPITVSRPTLAAQQLGYEKAGDVPALKVPMFQWMGLMEQIHQERLNVERPTSRLLLGGPVIQPGVLMSLQDAPYRPGFVSDRTTLDFLAYYQYRAGAENVPDAYWQIAVTYAHKYDLILYLPPNPNGVEDDNRRFTEGTQEIDANIRKILQENAGLSERIVEVPWGNVDERCEFVHAQLQKRGLL